MSLVLRTERDSEGQQIFHCEVVGISKIMAIFAPANPKGEA